MTATEFLELIVSVSLQAVVVVAATYWIGRLTDNERLRCRLWTVCYALLMLLVVNAAMLPHVRLMQPMRPLTRPLATEVVSLELQIGRVLFWGWVLGAVGALALLVYRTFQAERFLRSCRAVDPDVISLASIDGGETAGKHPQIDRKDVRLVSTAVAAPPFCWQFHQPYIVIPDNLLTYEQDDLKYILRHELAHLQTGHPLQLFLQRTVEILFWFHPVVWWASREWSMAREFLCDDEAIESRGDIVQYLKTLLTIAEQTARDDRPTATLAFVRNRCEMAERSRRLVRLAQQDTPTTSSENSTPRAGFATALLLATGLASVLLVWLPVNVLASPESHWSPW
ncbi:MAG: M56 family metallopeptidase, partial [Planctomycetota bacterium]